MVKLALLLVSLTAASASAASLTPEEVRAWRADLAFLRSEMPARHANLFHAMTPAAFDSALGAIDRALPALRRSRVIVELMRLDALVGDGHSNVSPWRDPEIRFHELPIALYLLWTDCSYGERPRRTRTSWARGSCGWAACRSTARSRG